MNDENTWLPALVQITSYGGDWEQYLEAIYGFFKTDFLDSHPYWRGERVTTTKHPYNRGLEAGFWHITSEGAVEADRIPDLRRCERIRWPRPILEQGDESRFKIWIEKRRGEDRVHIWIEDEDYVVVLAKRKGYSVLWTTYLAVEDHQRRNLLRRFEQAQKS